VDGTHLPPVPLEGPELAGYQDAHPLRAALPVCRDLIEDAVRESGWVFAVGDADGALLWLGGDPGARRRIERVNFVEGAVWSEARAGTNAPGTALAIGAPVQILGQEHFNEAVRAWSCAAAPVRDPDTGRVLGVVDITGGRDVNSPHVLALARATANAMESELARRLSAADRRAREVFLRKVTGSSAAALVSGSGRVLETSGSLAETHLTGLSAGADGTGTLPDGRRLVIEPVGMSGYLVVRFVAVADHPGDQLRTVRMSALGRDNAVLDIGGRAVKLSPRHSEIVVLLTLAEEGMSAGALAAGVSLDPLSTQAIRVDMSRLRGVLGDDLLASRPYRLLQRIRFDMHIVADLLADGRVRDALGVYPGPLLPCSQAPGIVEHRMILEHKLRAAVLAGGDASLLRRWVKASWGADDVQAWQALARALPAGSPQQVAVALQTRSLCTPPPRSPGRRP
jgi:hypothetical protein